MGRELQKKKRRSNRQPIRQHTRAKKVLNPRGSDLVAKNWDKKETLSQNYRRLGLASRLSAPTGGVEKRIHKPIRTTTTTSQKATTSASYSSSSSADPFAIRPVEEAILSEARVERDENGKIIRVHHSAAVVFNPLNDPLKELDTDSEEDDEEEQHEQENGDQEEEGLRRGAREDQHGSRWEEWGGIEEENDTEIVKSLIRESRVPGVKKTRHQSEREREWLEKLVARWGDDYGGMARDTKLNRMQQTAADLKRRVQKLAQA